MPHRRRGQLRPVYVPTCVNMETFDAVNGDGRPNSVEKLASKYMEQCKVESSTEESDVGPRSSDTSTMALGTSRQKKRPLQRTTSSLSHKAGGRPPCYCRFLDPYDGSSEDSGEPQRPALPPARRPRQHGGACNSFLCRSRRVPSLHPPACPPPTAGAANLELTGPPPASSTSTPTFTPSTPGAPPPQHPASVPMDSDGSSSEPWVWGLDSPWSSVSERSGCWLPVGTTCCPEREEPEEDRFEDSGSHSIPRSPTTPPLAGSPVHMGSAGRGSCYLDCGGSTESSPSPGSHGCCLYKRKMMGPPGVKVLELGQRKKRCVVAMDEEPGRGDCDAEMF